MASEERLRVAALMPSLNEEASVDSTFGSLFAGSRLPDEVIVADGGSTDRTIEKVEAWKAKGLPITIVPNTKVFPGAGRNAAVAASSADILVSVDFGNSFDPDFIAAMAAPFEADPDINIVAGTFVPKPQSPMERVIAIIDYHQGYMALRMSEEERRALAPPGDRHIPGGSVAWRRSLWEAAGGQPDWLRAAEDLLFGHRVLTLSPRFGLQLTAHTYHHMRPDLGAFFSMRKTYARGRCRAGLLTGAMVRRRAQFLALPALLIAGLWSPLLILIALGFAAFWVWRNVIVVLKAADGKWPGADDILRGIGVVAARETGSLVGMILGTIDWLRDPSWRKRRRAYLQDGSQPT